MKRHAVAAAAAAAVVLAALAALAPAARAQGDVKLAVQAGLSLPIGDFGDFASTGINLGLTGTYRLNDRLGFGGDLVWHRFGVDRDYEEALAVSRGSTVDVSASTLQITAHGVYYLPAAETLSPHLRAGLGLYSASSKVESAGSSDTSSDTDLGFHFGGGLDYKTSGALGYGLEAAYHYIASGGDATTMLTIAGRLTFGVGGK